jgi:uncharacterized protein YjiS (DUF1127 family)
MAYVNTNISASILSEDEFQSSTPLISLFRHGLQIAAAWRKRARNRAELALLSERDLRDIGADGATVELEAGRHFWQRPLAAWDEKFRSRR